MNIKSNSYFKRRNSYQLVLVFVLVLLTSLFQNCGRRYLPEELGNSDLNSNSVVGAKLYSDNCAVCHNPLDSTTIIDKTEVGIKNALQTQTQMQFISITQEEITHIATALNQAEGTVSKVRTISNVDESGTHFEGTDEDNEMNLHVTDQSH